MRRWYHEASPKTLFVAKGKGRTWFGLVQRSVPSMVPAATFFGMPMNPRQNHPSHNLELPTLTS